MSTHLRRSSERPLRILQQPPPKRPRRSLRGCYCTSTPRFLSCIPYRLIWSTAYLIYSTEGNVSEWHSSKPGIYPGNSRAGYASTTSFSSKRIAQSQIANEVGSSTRIFQGG